MEPSGLNDPKHDNEEKTLRGLIDAFGSAFSLEEIASAFCKAGRNADLVGEILYDMRGCLSTHIMHASTEVTKVESTESDLGNLSKNSCLTNGKLKPSKPRLRPISGGTVSSVLGKNYVKPAPLANGSRMATKPLRLDAKELPISEIWVEEGKSKSSKDDHMHKDMEDFLFKMLGDGFQLGRDVIREVLGSCGYDMQKSMEKLLDQSAAGSDKGHKALGKSHVEFIDTCPNSEGPSRQQKLQYKQSPGGVSSTNGGELPGQQKGRNDLQKEVLAALFNASEKSDELPRRTVKAVRRSRISGEVVVEPPKDFITEQKVDMVQSLQHNADGLMGDEDEEDSFQALRKAVKEYRATMKEYYKAAIDAFAKGERARAGKLLEQGQFFRERAREADEESNQKIFETRHAETNDEMLLDLHEHRPKEAIRLLKCHLSSLSGIPSFKYLKVIMETNEEDVSKGARRRLVMKLLEKESIKWIEDEENPGAVLIRLDNINPKQLSFAKK